jgi:pectate lyase
MHKLNLAFSGLVLASLSGPAFSLPAFPGAEGFGTETPGGRGGKVIEVTNLNDSGPGSLRAALTASGPRIVVFKVAGTIELSSRIEVKEPYLTVAGQTAPGDGITIKNHESNGKGPMRISTHDVVLRYLRIRSAPSPNDGGTLDAMTMYPGPYNVVVDHCSFSWGTDEVFQTGGAHDFTIQWSIVAEGLRNATHPEGDHSKGMHFRDANSDNISAHHNLLAHNEDRNPNVNSSGIVDLVNNVFYNATRWTEIKDKFGEPKANIVNNYYKMGPSSGSKGYEVFYYDSTGQQPRVYVSGNIGFHRPTNDLPDAEIVREDSRWMIVNSRFPAPSVTTFPANEAFTKVLDGVGATLPVRDAHDASIVDDVRNGTGSLINDPSEVGGWLVMAPGTPLPDDDKDGMPNEWEQANGLNSSNAADGSQDADNDGYTNVEEYLNGTDPRVAGGDVIDPPPATGPGTDGPEDPEEPEDPTIDPGVGGGVDSTGSDTLTFAPVADATIRAGSPNTNYGSEDKLEVDKSSRADGLIKFAVSGIGSDQVASAKLRLYNSNSSKTGGDFYPVADSSWSEQSVTWNNAPPADQGKIASLGAVTKGNWYEVDVTSLIKGDGEYSLRLQSTSSDGADYRSKERSGFAPQLIVTVK